MQALAGLYALAPWHGVLIVIAAAVLAIIALLIGDGRRSMELSEYDREEDPPMK